MAEREKTFKKPSYSVNKRTLERYIRSKCGVLRLAPMPFSVGHLIFRKNMEAMIPTDSHPRFSQEPNFLLTPYS
jgi:hypothetical protein